MASMLKCYRARAWYQTFRRLSLDSSAPDSTRSAFTGFVTSGTSPRSWCRAISGAFTRGVTVDFLNRGVFGTAGLPGTGNQRARAPGHAGFALEANCGGFLDDRSWSCDSRRHWAMLSGCDRGHAAIGGLRAYLTKPSRNRSQIHRPS
jgi:hypothetical protein